MKERLTEYLVSPGSGQKLALAVDKRNGEDVIEGMLTAPDGTQYPIRRGIPRFVSSEEYTETFGFQWNRHARIYFDNKDQHRVYSTQDQLQQKLGLSPEKVRGKIVLDIGCGTGANGAAISEWGAQDMFCVDLSLAVEAAYANTKHLSNVHVIQADLFKLPFRKESFDVIYSIGVLMTTPDTKKAFLSLVPSLKENGVVAIWIYPDVPDISQRLSDRLRSVTTRIDPKLLYNLCWLAVPAYYLYKIPLIGKALFHFLPPISKEPYWEDRVLDTFDWYSPKYQWKHTYPEVHDWFREANLTDIHLQPVPVSMWGRKPASLDSKLSLTPDFKQASTGSVVSQTIVL